MSTSAETSARRRPKGDKRGRTRAKLVARKGDTLESIGRKYDLTKYDVARINRRSYHTPLRPGEEILVYRVVDRAKAKKAGVFDKKKKAGGGKGKGGKGKAAAAAGAKKKKK